MTVLPIFFASCALEVQCEKLSSACNAMFSFFREHRTSRKIFETRCDVDLKIV